MDVGSKRPLDEEKDEQQQQPPEPKRKRRAVPAAPLPAEVPSSARKRAEAEIKLAKKLSKELSKVGAVDLKNRPLNRFPNSKGEIVNVVHHGEAVKELATGLEIANLLDLTKDEGAQQAKYFVTGVPGCGKTTLVREIVGRMRMTNRVRVIYLEDLQEGLLLEELLHGMIHAFPKDEYIQNLCLDACDGDGDGIDRDKVMELYKNFPAYSVSSNKDAYLILDDLEKFYESSSGLADFLKTVMELEAWKKWATVVFVGSPSRRAGCTMVLPDPFLGDTITVKASKDEATAKEILKELGVTKVTNRMGDIFNATGYVPGELAELARCVKAEEEADDSIVAGIRKFRKERRAELTKVAEETVTMLETSGGAKELAMAVLLMKFQIPVLSGMDYKLDPKLMYVKNIVGKKSKSNSAKDVELISAISELAGEALIDTVLGKRVQLEKWAVQELVAKVVESPEGFSAEVKALAVRLMLVNYITSEKTLHLKNVLVPGRDKQTWSFSGVMARSYRRVASINVGDGYYLLRPAYNLDSLTLFVQEEAEDDTPSGLVAIEVCLDLKGVVSNKFYMEQAPEWMQNENLKLAEDEIHHLWIVPNGSAKALDVKSDKWGKPDKGKARNYFITLKDLVKNNEGLSQLEGLYAK